MSTPKRNTVRTATIDDVARLAGVSTATVSRAISSPQKVRASTSAKVTAAIAKLHYVPHGAARALASSRTYTMGAIFPSLDAIFADTAYGLQKELDRHRYSLVVCCSEYDSQIELRMARNLIERGVDGLIVVGTTHDVALYRLARLFKKPLVFTWASGAGHKYSCVGFDNRRATALAAEHLLDLGHRRFGVISGITANNERVRERLAGIVEALAQRGVALDRSSIIEAPFRFEAGRQALSAILATDAKGPTAIICSNDILAVGAMAECHARGIAVPKDMSVVGCGNFSVSAMVVPSLTTVQWPTLDLGIHAAKLILNRLDGDKKLKQLEFPVDLVVRESSAGPKSKRDCP